MADHNQNRPDDIPSGAVQRALSVLSGLSRKQKSWIFLAVDLGLIPLALFTAYAVQSLPASAPETMIRAEPILPFLMLIGAGLSWALGIPQIVLNDYEGRAIWLTAIFAVGLGLAAAGLSWLAGLALPLGTHVMFATLYLLLAVVTRVLLRRLVMAIYRRGRPRRPVLIYGAGTTGSQLVRALRAHESIEPVAFIDDNVALHGVLLSGLPVHSPTRIADLAEKYGARRVLLAMPSASQPRQAQIARRLQDMGLEVQALPSFAQLIGEEELLDKLKPVAPQRFLGRDSRAVPLGDALSAYRGRVVLVSGAGGSIGSELCRQLLTCRPARLVLFELSELALYNIDQELTQLLENTDLKVDIVPVLGSVTDARQVRRVLAENAVQVVLHAAAYKHVPLVEANPLPGLANNVFGTRTLAMEAIAAGVERFILVSSDKAVRPANVMGASKRIAELVVQDLATRSSGTILAMVRFGNVLGSSGSVVPLFQEQVSRGGPLTVTHPEVERFFMTIREAVTLVLKAGAAGSGGEVFVLDMGKPVPIMKLARQVIERAGYSVRDDANPEGDIEIVITGMRPGEKLSEELTLTDDLVGTRYQKIFWAREDRLSELQVAAVLRRLRQALAAGDAVAAREALSTCVEDYPTDDADCRTS